MNNQPGSSSNVPSVQQEVPVDYAGRHLRFGWWSLLVFTALGLGLESLHGFKVRAYLDVSNETRRLMWTLAHAHGTLLSIVNIVLALTLRTGSRVKLRTVRVASTCLILATILLPGGFFLGGITVYGGDPSLGIVIVPVGAGLLLVAIYVVSRDESLCAAGKPGEHAIHKS